MEDDIFLQYNRGGKAPIELKGLATPRSARIQKLEDHYVGAGIGIRLTCFELPPLLFISKSEVSRPPAPKASDTPRPKNLALAPLCRLHTGFVAIP